MERYITLEDKSLDVKHRYPVSDELYKQIHKKLEAEIQELEEDGEEL